MRQQYLHQNSQLICLPCFPQTYQLFGLLGSLQICLHPHPQNPQLRCQLSILLRSQQICLPYLRQKSRLSRLPLFRQTHQLSSPLRRQQICQHPFQHHTQVNFLPHIPQSFQLSILLRHPQIYQRYLHQKPPLSFQP